MRRGRPGYGKVTAAIVGRLEEIVGQAHVVRAAEDLEPYSHDETDDLRFPPEVAVRPASTEEVSQILRICHAARIPVTPRGGGTGLSGGALPVHGGIVLSVERMNRILEIDTRNLMAVVQAGVITEVLQQEVEKVGLFYPPDPASRGSCLIGGNVAECAGGPRALKYGVTKDYVYGVEAVLADGAVLRSGGKLLKNVTGYNLAQLLVGCEGTLAVVTEVTLKLLPLPTRSRTLLVPFDDLEAAARAVTGIFRRKVVPCAVEYMERPAVEAVEAHLGRRFPHSEHEALLLIEVDGNDPAQLEREIEVIAEVCMAEGAPDILVAQDRERQRSLWEMRRSIGEAVKSLSRYKEEDTVVPRDRLPDLVRAVREVTGRHGVRAISYGHAGDGNLHVNILKREMPQRDWEERLPAVIRELFARVVALGGTISGEHGIGLTQRDYLPLALSPVEIELMRGIKALFDPRGILNPGKIFPEDGVRGSRGRWGSASGSGSRGG